MASLPVVKGTLDVLVLRALQWTPMHGFEITSWLEERSANSLEVEDSAVYQALYRMEERGLIEAEWGVTENQRQARASQGANGAMVAVLGDGDDDTHRRTPLGLTARRLA